MKFIFLNKARATRTLLKNYAVETIVLIIITVIALNYLIDFTLSNAELFKTLYKEAFIIICFIKMIIYLTGETCIMKIHPASIQFFLNSHYFNKVKILATIVTLCKTVVFCFIICFVLSSGKLNSNHIEMPIAMLFFYIITNILSWIKYNNGNKAALLFLELISFLSVVLIYTTPVFLPLIAGIFFVSIVWKKSIRLDMVRFMDDMIIQEKIDRASRYRNDAEVQQLAAEKLSKKQHKPFLARILTKRNALIWKIVIETIRYSKRVKIFLLMLVSLAAILSSTMLFNNFPLLEEPQIRNTIAVICFTLCMSAIRGTVAVQLDKFINKTKIGLFVPYSKNKIVLSYGSVGAMIAIVYALASCVMAQTTITTMIVIVFVVFCTFISSFYLETKGFSRMALMYICNFLFLGIGSILYVL